VYYVIFPVFFLLCLFRFLFFCFLFCFLFCVLPSGCRIWGTGFRDGVCLGRVLLLLRGVALCCGGGGLLEVL